MSIALGLLVGAPIGDASGAATAAAAHASNQPRAATTLAPSTLAAGFVDETVVTGLNSPTTIVFAPNGRVFVGEKRGVVKTWPTLAAFNANAAPVQTVDFRTDVMNYWDRGLLGLAVDPGFPTQPYIYVLYTYNALPGGVAPQWPSSDGSNDQCPTDPGGNSDGCVVQNRLERITVNTSTGVSTARLALLTGWCQQFPSHSAGSLLFGPDGKLYATGGEGASFNTGAQDYGQKGGTRPNTTSPVTPVNPCGDPPTPAGTEPSAPTAEGGALRAQSFRRAAGEAAVLNGAVLRLDPASGNAATGNPALANADPVRRRIVAYGLRNPFRMTFRPGTDDLYVGDVGYSTWEEINRVADPTTGPTNYGWPCREGPQSGTYYSLSLNLCTSLAAGAATSPLYTYAQTAHMASGDGCPPLSGAPSASASISGLAFYTGSAYPAQYHGALFVADYSRNCIVVLPDSGTGVPSPSAIPFDSAPQNPVMLTTEPGGDLVYVDLNGEIHRLRYQPPVASFSATPSTGAAPLTVSFDGTGSSAPAGIDTYDWDFGDGTPHDSGATTSHQYAAGTWTARLTITDANGVTATKQTTIASGNSAPTVTLDQPSCTNSCWAVGDTIHLDAHATDLEDGALPASAFSWHVGLEHCHSPSDCHEHDLLDADGLASTSFTAPDHDAGSWLRITVTATDSGGLTSTASIDVNPKTSTLTVTSSPGGLPVTLDGVTANGSIGPATELVGHAATVLAASSVASGETTWAFKSWSDGGALSHAVTVGSTPKTVTATYVQTSSDAPNTCAAAPVQAATGAWSTAKFAAANDIDWIRFTVPKTSMYRLVLGALPVDGILSLYSGCSTLLATSNTAGLHWEEIVRSLSAGSYALKLSTVGGASSPSSYKWLVQALSGSVAFVSGRSVPGSTVRLVGEVLNTTTAPRNVTVTARLYSASGALLKTVSGAPMTPAVAANHRASFVIKTTKPAGFATVRYTVTSSAASRATRLLSASGVTGTAPSPGTWNVTGWIVNSTSTTAHSVAYMVTIYDSSGTAINATAGTPSGSTLAAGARASFSMAFTGLDLTPIATSGRGRAS